MGGKVEGLQALEQVEREEFNKYHWSTQLSTDRSDQSTGFSRIRIDIFT